MDLFLNSPTDKPVRILIRLPTEAAAMSFFEWSCSKHLCFAFSLSLGLVPSLLSAQQLSQPASILPWRSSPPEVKLALQASQETRSKASDSPAWLIESAKPLTQLSPTQDDMPMVETESYANLGQINRRSADQKPQSIRPIRRKNASPSSSNRSFSLLRALGFKINRSDDRR